MFSIVEDYLASSYRYIKSCQRLPLCLPACDMALEKDNSRPNCSIFTRRWLFRSVKTGILTASDSQLSNYDDPHVMEFS